MSEPMWRPGQNVPPSGPVDVNLVMLELMRELPAGDLRNDLNWLLEEVKTYRAAVEDIPDLVKLLAVYRFAHSDLMIGYTTIGDAMLHPNPEIGRKGVLAGLQLIERGLQTYDTARST